MEAETKSGYKMTELGLIPSDWEVFKLNNLSNITRLAGYEYTTYWKETPNGEIIALRGFNIGSNKIIDKELVRISNDLSLKLKRSKLFEGDVIYPCVGTIGNAVVINENDKYHIQQNIAKITPNKEIIKPEYLAYYLMSSFGFSEIEKFNGSSSQPNILVGSLRNYSIITPPLPEQTAIATSLKDTDDLINSLEKLIAKKKLIKQGAMQELLKPKEGWVKKKLGEVLVYEQPTQYLVESTEYNDNNPIPVLTAGKGLILGYTDENTNIYNNLPVIIFDDFTTSSHFINFPFKMKSSAMKLLRLKDRSNNNLKFIFEILKKVDYMVSDHKRHWIGEFQKLEILVPTIDEQNKVASIIFNFDIEIESLEFKLSKLQTIKQGMMQQLLTGKIRLV